METCSEIWKPVPGFEGRYEVSSFGQVRSLELVADRPGVKPFVHPLSNRILAQSTDKRGYKLVMLHKGANATRRTYRVHRLVCAAFNGGSLDTLLEVLHKDDNPGNNSPDNLRWGSHDENLKDAIANSRIRKGAAHPRARLSDEDVAQIRRLKADGMQYKQIAERFGIHWCYAQKIVLGKMRN